MTLKAIETVYKGYRFRSRLEARWAVYFDAIGVEWEYEPEGFELEGVRYLPDFWLKSVHMFAEVKPDAFTDVEYAKCVLLAKHTRRSVLMLDGTPDRISYWAIGGGGGWETDYVLDTQYVQTESRFFGSTGASNDMAQRRDALDGWDLPDLDAAVVAARSARFEHGEQGIPSTKTREQNPGEWYMNWLRRCYTDPTWTWPGAEHVLTILREQPTHSLEEWTLVRMMKERFGDDETTLFYAKMLLARIRQLVIIEDETWTLAAETIERAQEGSAE